MTRALVVLQTPADREKVARWAHGLPTGTRCEFKAPRRTMEQNSKMWAMLTEISEQKQHAGNHYSPDKWKCLFLHACGREVQFIPSLDGTAFIPWGQSSSDLSKGEMADLIEFIYAWGAENGVVFKDMGQ